MAFPSTNITESSAIPTASTTEVSPIWEEMTREFARRRDELVVKYSSVREEVMKARKDHSLECKDLTSIDQSYAEQVRNLTDSVDDLWIETLDLLRLIYNSHLDDKKVGRCFRLKVQIIRYLIEGIIESPQVKTVDYYGVLDILRTHLGRLTLDASVEWDESADKMDIVADNKYQYYNGLAATSAVYKQKLSRKVLLRDMRWFRDCWHLLNWYHPKCSCVQCIERVGELPFRKVRWGYERSEPKPLDLLSGAEILDPLESWKVEMNDRLGETY